VNNLTPGQFAHMVNESPRFWIPIGKYRVDRQCWGCGRICVAVYNGRRTVLLDMRSARLAEFRPALRTYAPTMTAIDHTPLCGAQTPEGWITCQPM